MITKKDEFIGEKIEIIKSTDINKKGIKGLIVDETKNLFILITEDGEKRIPKKEITFKIKGQIFEGRELLKRPWERIKI